jgi:hypothetical protein
MQIDSSAEGSPSFLDAVPTAELEPISETYVQADEASRPAKSRFHITDLAYRPTWG